MPASVPAPPLGNLYEQLPNDLRALIQLLRQGELTQAGSELLLRVAVPAIMALLSLIVIYFVAKLAARWVSAALCLKIDKTIGRFAGKLTFYTILTLSSLAVLQTAGVSITSFAAVLAAAGFAVGLAFQGTLSNFAAGILLLVFRPFRVGDLVIAAGVTGKVNEIDLFTTTLDTPDNRRLIIPNSSIAGTTIENVTFHKHRRVDVPVGVAYAASLDETRAALTLAAESLADVTIQGEGRGFQILLTNLGTSSVDWTVRVWAATENFFPVKERLTAAVKRQLDVHGLEIAFPQMQLHFTPNDHDGERASGPHRAWPIPKMATSGGQAATARVRPRPRGETTGS